MVSNNLNPFKGWMAESCTYVGDKEMELVSEQRDFVFCPCKKIQRTKARETRRESKGQGSPVRYVPCISQRSTQVSVLSSWDWWGARSVSFLF